MGKKKKQNNKNQKKETLFEKAYVQAGNIFSWITLFIYLVGLPLYLKNGYDMVATNKYKFFMHMSVYVLIFFFVYFIGYYVTFGFSKEKRAVFDPIKKLDIAMLSFIAVVFISHLFSSYKHAGYGSDYFFYEGSFYGTSGWFMGFATFFILVSVYFFISRFFHYTEYFWIPIVIITSFIFIWGMLNRYGIYPFNLKTDNPFLLATLGNINWFASFASVLSPVILGLYWGVDKTFYKVLLIIPVLLSYMQALLNGSDSGVFSYLITMFVLLIISLKQEERFLRFIELFVLFTISANVVHLIDNRFQGVKNYSGLLSDIFIKGKVPFVLILVSILLILLWILIYKEKINFGNIIKNVLGKILAAFSVLSFAILFILITVNTKTGGVLPIIGNSSYFVFDSAWGSNRGATWKAGAMTIKSLPFFKKFIGSGPDTFYFQLVSDDAARAFTDEVFSGQRLTNAHNEIITLLANIGILGAFAFLAIAVIMFMASVKASEKKPTLIIFALSVVMYIANNQFSFEQIIGTPIYFVIISVGAAAIVRENLYSKGFQVDKQKPKDYNSKA